MQCQQNLVQVDKKKSLIWIFCGGGNYVDKLRSIFGPKSKNQIRQFDWILNIMVCKYTDK